MPLLRQVDGYLERAVQSLVDQTVPAEIIVVISPKTPPSNLAILARHAAAHPSFEVVMRPEGAGFPGAINAGIRRVTADRFGILLSDDWLDDDAVELCLPYDVDIVSAGLNVYAADGVTYLPEVSGTARAEHYEMFDDLQTKADYLRHFFLFRTAKVREVGGLDETLGDTPGIDDYDFIWTMLEHGATVALPGRSAYNCRDHEGERMTLRDPAEKAKTLLRIFDKHGFQGPQREAVYLQHLRWYGKTLQEARREIFGNRS
jgi:glycosyltransferase involved in cell wall biosynthesis